MCALVGCAAQPLVATQARWQHASIEAHWVSKKDIGEVCKKLGLETSQFNGCARSKPNSAVCEVYAVQPTSFDDVGPLEVFGHEVWHCLGAKHI
jgi:hypothetical protein